MRPCWFYAMESRNHWLVCVFIIYFLNGLSLCIHSRSTTALLSGEWFWEVVEVDFKPVNYYYGLVTGRDFVYPQPDCETRVYAPRFPTMAKGTKKGGKGKSRNSANPSAGATSYTGPISLPQAISEHAQITKRLAITGLVTSVSGDVNAIFSSDCTSAGDWSEMSGVYDSYRPLAIKLHYMPLYRYDRISSSTSVVVYPVATVIDYNDGTTALTSWNDAVDYDSFELHHFNTPFTREVRASGVQQMAFFPTSAAPTSLYSIKFWSNSNASAIDIGRYVLEYLVQFKGAR